MIEKNTKQDYKLYCLTDDLFGIDEEIGIIRLPENNTYESHWNKMYLFDNDVVGLDKFLYMDLDVVIQNNIDELLNFTDNKLTLIKALWKDPKVWSQFNSSVMSIDTTRDRYVHNMFIEDYNYHMVKNVGDEDFLVKNFSLSTFPSEWFYSRVYGNERSSGRYFKPERMICILNGMKVFYPHEYYQLFDYYYSNVPMDSTIPSHK